MNAPPDWLSKPLTELSDGEWEQLCDGCGRCCLHKIEDDDTGELFFTRIACRLLDLESCRCEHYAERLHWVTDCLDLRRGFTRFDWLPSTCAYRLRHEGKSLPAWHPLISGRPESTREAGMTVGDFAISECDVANPEEHVIEWLK